jgi:multidrug efflux system membrane fusion protein
MKTKHYSAILFLLASAAAAGCSQARAYEKPLTPVRAQAVTTFTPSAEGGGTRYSATIRPATQLDLAFKSGGYVRELLQVRGADGRMRSVQEGDWVKKGAALARLREDDFAAKVKGAEAQVAEARSALESSKAQQAEAEAAMRQAKRDMERAVALLESNSITKPEHDAARTRFEMTEAKVAAAKAQVQVIQAKINAALSQLAEAQLAKGDAVLRAPADSLVLRRTVEEGSLVAPGAPIITLAEAGSVKAVFGVPDLTVQSLQQGTELTLTTEAIPGVEFHGLITRISAAADPKTRIFEVEVTINRSPTQLRAGMIASLVVPDANASIQPVTVVPLSAIVRSPESPDSYAVSVIVEENGKQVARRRAVKLGETYGNLIGVNEGLQAGEQVVVSGASVASDGEQVQITQ